MEFKVIPYLSAQAESNIHCIICTLRNTESSVSVFQESNSYSSICSPRPCSKILKRRLLASFHGKKKISHVNTGTRLQLNAHMRDTQHFFSPGNFLSTNNTSKFAGRFAGCSGSSSARKEESSSCVSSKSCLHRQEGGMLEEVSILIVFLSHTEDKTKPTEEETENLRRFSGHSMSIFSNRAQLEMKPYIQLQRS